MKKYRYTVAVLLAGVLWGVIGIFVRALDGVGADSMQIVFLRSFFSAVLLFLSLALFGREYIKIRLRDLWCFLGTGLCSLAFFNFCYFYSITTVSLSVASVLLYTAPAFVAVMSAFLFRERLNGARLLCLGLAIVGCVLVTGVLFEEHAPSFYGILTGLGAGFGYALYSIFGRYALNRGYHTFTVNLWTFIIASISIVWFARPLDLLCKVAAVDFPWYAVIGLVAVSTLLPYLLYTYGLTGMESGRASVIATVEPVVATLTGGIFFGERLTLANAIGILLVLSAVVLLNLPITKKGRESNPQASSSK